jgi:hypothetical protein
MKKTAIALHSDGKPIPDLGQERPQIVHHRLPTRDDNPTTGASFPFQITKVACNFSRGQHLEFIQRSVTERAIEIASTKTKEMS